MYRFGLLLEWLFGRKKITIFRSNSKPIQRHVIIERGTIRHLCAIDSLMTIIESTGDYDTFSDNGDLELFIEYVFYCNANKKAIAKEENKPYKY